MGIPLPQSLFEVRWNETPKTKCQPWKCKIVQPIVFSVTGAFPTTYFLLRYKCHVDG